MQTYDPDRVLRRAPWLCVSGITTFPWDFFAVRSPSNQKLVVSATINQVLQNLLYRLMRVSATYSATPISIVIAWGVARCVEKAATGGWGG